jgi:hypothetical protein
MVPKAGCVDRCDLASQEIAVPVLFCLVAPSSRAFLQLGGCRFMNYELCLTVAEQN